MRDDFPTVSDFGIGYRCLAVGLDITHDALPAAGIGDPASAHADAARRSGGAQIAASQHPPVVVGANLPDAWRVVVGMPEVAWSRARVVRDALPRDVPTMKHYRQAALVAALTTGILRGDAQLVHAADADAVIDVSVGPRLPAYFPCLAAAREAGALFVGLDPGRMAVVALADSPEVADAIETALVSVFQAHAMRPRVVVACPAPFRPTAA